MAGRQGFVPTRGEPEASRGVPESADLETMFLTGQYLR